MECEMFRGNAVKMPMIFAADAKRSGGVLGLQGVCREGRFRQCALPE